MLLSTAALLLAAAVQPAVSAGRPDGTPICDYYAKENYGENNKTTQLKLMTKIVALAYAGGDELLKAGGENKNDSGIFGSGSYKGEAIFLGWHFDGSHKTSAFNGNAAAMNWTDGGGMKPLRDFLDNKTATAEIAKGTNQYTLFTHWYVAFGRIFGCTKAEEFLNEEYKTLMPAYVHQFMNLTQTQISYFIRQLSLSSKYHGFSESDASTLDTFMNNKYNNKCAPPQNNSLPSICFHESCPLAFPSPDCKAYTNIQQYSVSDNTKPGSSGTSAASPSSDRGTDGSSDLGTGAIAGIAVGGVAGIGIIIGLIWFFFKRKAAATADAARRAESLAAAQSTPGGGGGYPNAPMYSPAMTQSQFDGSVSQQWDGVSQTPYDPNRQSQFTYFSSVHDGSGSPPPPHPHHGGWAELPPQELHANEVAATMNSPPLSPTMDGSQTKKLGYKPDVRDAVEMESPVPRQQDWAKDAAANPEENPDRRQ
ncbi:hypothetical protein ISF_05410 [Cordyceps fumosorosea ARSEF 2679]|uniref:Uncharacterized protein n=1 Tax=Cordyceps fumosorosea (strain ARSEF 2679) TaxID=1081104 RepID=A0A167U8D4_CORFA|nr:hypothetical protein ISF_05410 [Cordyceps fumosorosea ARSEF 2679]OAA61331.1 hypothetical protein ISF_05410 [Cordyceps fumosorosea ARSEF 2679]